MQVVQIPTARGAGIGEEGMTKRKLEDEIGKQLEEAGVEYSSSML